MRMKVYYILAALAIPFLIRNLYVVLLKLPDDADQGAVYRIMFYHVPSWFTAGIACVLALVSSVMYLVKRNLRWDALAVATTEVGVMFITVGLITGSIWGRQAWGIWWTWDPQLTTALLTVLIYLAVVLLRAFSQDGEAERRFAAALGVLGALNVPIIRYSVQKWGGNHPVVLRKGGAGLSHPAMVEAVRIGFVAMALLCIAFIWLRTEHYLLRSRLVRAEQEALGRGLGES